MTYRAMFKQTLIATLIGGLGVFAGILVGIPWFLTVIIMTLLSFFAAIVSNYGMPFSVGTMIGLVIATVVVGAPFDGMGWKLYISFQMGTVLYLLLLGCEALFDSHYPERQLLSKHIKTLANFARTKSQHISATQADKAKIQNSLDSALDSYFVLYSALLSRKYHNFPERIQETEHQAALLHALDSTLSHLIAVNDDQALLSNAAIWLDEIQNAVIHKRKTPPQPPVFLQKQAVFFILLCGFQKIFGAHHQH